MSPHLACGDFLRVYMKYKKIWVDDNTVEISRKKRVHRNNSKISSKYELFSPEDLCFETEKFEVNASVNKESFHCSNYFEDSIDRKSHLINKGGRKYTNHLGSSFSRMLLKDGIEIDLDEDIDIGDDDEC